MNQDFPRFVAQLLSVQQADAARLDPSEAPQCGNWDARLSWLDDAGLALHLLIRLKNLGLHAVLPADVTAQLEHNLATNRRRLGVMTTEFNALNRKFERYGVKYAVLKGFALEPQFCPDATLRTWHDYDYLIDADSADLAAQALQSEGFLRQAARGSWADRPTQLVFSTQASHLPSNRDAFYSASLQRPVELHSALWDRHHNRVYLQLPRDALQRRRLITRRGAEYYGLDDDDALLFHAVHAFQHLLDGWCRPSWFLEIAHFLNLRFSDRKFWSRFDARIGSCAKLREAVTFVFALATHLFGGETPAFGHPAKSLHPALSLWIHRYGYEWSLAKFPGSKLSLFAYREFIEDRAVWRQLCRCRLLPIHRPTRVFDGPGVGVRRVMRHNADQWSHVVRRLVFHARSTLRYAAEAPRWGYCRRKLYGFERAAGCDPAKAASVEVN